ncbi:MAG: hypothetical protein HBSIN02_20170 [Bacteroidia bacterium]|nr:MAG: hypothetical protein HBSIN02_20170 [Bacteroidia bacterium]
MKVLATAFLFLTAVSISTAQTLIVNTRQDVVDTTDGLLSLREAIEAANNEAGPNAIIFDANAFGPDSVILLNESLVINDTDGLTITGRPDTTILAPSPLLDGIRFDGLIIKSGGVTLSNLTFSGFKGTAIAIDTVSGGPVVIGPGNILTGSEDYGIRVARSRDVTIRGNIVTESGSYGYSEGIVVMDSSSNILIEENVIMWSNNSGIGTFQSDSLTVRRNYLGRNAGGGVRIFEGEGYNVVEENIVAGNYLDGISIYAGEYNMIRKNAIGDSSAVYQVPTVAMALARVRTDGVPVMSGETQSLLLARSAAESRRARVPLVRPDPPVSHRKRDQAPPTPAEPRSTSAGTATMDHVGNFGNGISLYGTAYTTIEDNLIYGSGYVGIILDEYLQGESYVYPSFTTIQRNRIERSNDAQIWFYQVGPLLIQNNTLQYSYGGIIGGDYYYGEGYYAGSVLAKTVAVQSAYPSAVTIVENHISQVDDNAAIYLSAIDSAFISRNLLMNCYEGVDLYQTDDAVIQLNELSNITYYAFTVYSSDSTWINDNKVHSAYYGIYASGNYEGLGVLVAARNRFSALYYNAVSLYGLHHAVLDANVVESGGYSAGIDAEYVQFLHVVGNTGPSVYVYEVDSVVVEKNKVRIQYNNNSLSLNYVRKAYVSDNTTAEGSGGAYFSNVDSLWVWKNSFLQSKYTGLSVEYSRFAHVWENDIYGHQGTGVALDYADSVFFERNNVTGNMYSGLSTYGNGGLLIKNNTILENGDYGIISTSDTVLAVVENFIAQNEGGFSISYTTNDSWVTGNTFFRNLEGSYYYGAIQSLNAEGNFWGDASGPRDVDDSDGLGLINNGRGDHVSDQIDWDPFLQAPTYLSEARPDIAEVTPAQSPRAGGGAAVLKGRQILPGATVVIGTDTLETYEYVSSDLLTFTIPPGPGGPVHVIVYNANGKADTLFKGFMYDNNSPFPFNLVAPAPNTKVASAPRFVWTRAIDPDGDPVEYILEYAPSSTFEGSVRLSATTDTSIYLSAGALTPNTTYFWRVVASDKREGFASSPVSTFETDVVLSTGKDQALPTTYAVQQNYPNPFNPETTIRFQIPEAARVSLKVFDLLGREVATLVNDEMDVGFHSVTWNGRNLYGQQVASGVYFFRIEAGSFVETRRMLLVR